MGQVRPTKQYKLFYVIEVSASTYSYDRQIVFAGKCVVVGMNEDPWNISLDATEGCGRKKNVAGNYFEPDGIDDFVILVEQASSRC